MKRYAGASENSFVSNLPPFSLRRLRHFLALLESRPQGNRVVANVINRIVISQTKRNIKISDREARRFHDNFMLNVAKCDYYSKRNSCVANQFPNQPARLFSFIQRLRYMSIGYFALSLHIGPKIFKKETFIYKIEKLLFFD